MNRIYAIALIGIAFIAAVVLLATEGCMSAGPPIQPPEICEQRAIQFNWADPEKPGECEVYADPEELDDVKECAQVLFINLTDKEILIVFDENTSGKTSPFSEITTISLGPNGGPDEYAKAFPVTFELTDGAKYQDFPYHVEIDKDPETEQSPRIRIGPRTAPSEPGG